MWSRDPSAFWVNFGGLVGFYLIGAVFPVGFGIQERNRAIEELEKQGVEFEPEEEAR